MIKKKIDKESLQLDVLFRKKQKNLGIKLVTLKNDKPSKHSS